MRNEDFMEELEQRILSMDRTTAKFGYVDSNGNVVIQQVYEGVWPFNDCYAKVSAGAGMRGVIDRSGNIKVPLAYNYIYAICDDAAIVIDDSSCQGLIDIKYGYQLPCIYYEIVIQGRNEDDFIVCEISDGWNFYTIVLNGGALVCDDIMTKDKMPQINGLVIEKRIKDKKCNACRGRLVSGHYRSSPDTWVHLAGRQGYLTICIDCYKWIDFRCEIMN